MLVTDTAPANSAHPKGEVFFASNNPAGELNPLSCTLNDVPGSANQASCKVDYTPAAGGPHEIVALYSGSADLPGFQPSQGTSSVQANLRPTRATLSCTPAQISGNGASDCVATVVDEGPGVITPTGEVKFTSDGPGGFSANGSCQLVGQGPGTASRAVNAQGVADPSPAIHRWKVK